MAVAHYVKKARKTYRGTGIKKGMPYYWWKFRRGPLMRSLTAPRASQLTQSEFWSGYHSSMEAFEDAVKEASTMDDLKEAVSNLREAIDNIKDETEEKKNNMPESLQDSATGELLQERVEGLEEFITEIEGLDIPDEEESDKEDDEETEEDSEPENNLEATKQELQSLSGYSGS